MIRFTTEDKGDRGPHLPKCRFISINWNFSLIEKL